MKKDIQELFDQSNHQTVELGVKGTVGLTGSLMAMSLNEWAGFLVAVLTGIYMCLQIESAWRNRKAAKENWKNAKDNN